MISVYKLLKAAQAGNLSQAEMLLAQGVSVNAINANGWTALHGAVFSEQYPMVELLLSKGAHPNTQTTTGMTALHYAASRGYYAIAQALLNHNATVTLKDHKQQTALHWATSEGRQDIVALLLNYTTEINSKNKHGKNLVHQATLAGNQTIVEMLSDKGVAINARDMTGNTPLHLAVQIGQHAIVQVLLHKGAKVNAKNNNKKTPLHEAAFAGQQATVEALLEAGALINAQDREGDTPLHVAAYENHEVIVRLFLERKAIMDIQNRNHHTPLHEAAWGRCKQAMQQLLQKGAYSYPHKLSDKKLIHYWREPIDDIEANQPFYTTLLLAGVSTQNQTLPSVLQSIENTIEATVALWLKPLHLTKDECQRITPELLRALPRLIGWLGLIDQAEQTRKKHKDALKESYSTFDDYIVGLKHFLLIPKSDQGERAFVIQGLQSSFIPLEVLGLIRESLLRMMIVDTLVKIYPIPLSVANYIVAGARNNPEAYISFHQRLFQHDWESLCPLPFIESTTQCLSNLSCS